jgi:hypothetical protein
LIKLAAPEVVKSRLETCDGCNKRVLGVCSECGCVLAFKTRKIKSKCPLGKWVE